MALPRSFVLDRIGGHRRSVVEGGGPAAWVCAFLGPRDAAVDVLGEAGALAARVQGGTMEVRDYHARLASGERLRVLGAPPQFEVHSDRRAETTVEVAPEPGGARTFSWRRDGGIDAVLRTFPATPAEPWTLEVAGPADPLRCLVALLAAERLLREIEDADQPAR